MTTIGNQLEKIRCRIHDAAQKVGRSAEEITLVAVSKTHPTAAAQEAYDAGQRVFGESRIQEALPKTQALPSDARWHFIGHLQSNKIRKALPHFEIFHGIDSLSTAEAMSRIAGELGVRTNILLEVNLAGEATKFGISPDELAGRFDIFLGLKHVNVMGLMAIPPAVDDPEASRPYFVTLRELRDGLVEKFNAPLPVLSMGMSDDFEVAVEEGATMVRVGTSIFGRRPSPAQHFHSDVQPK